MNKHPKIELHAITRDNWQECVSLTVAEGQQKFVATNAHSLAMAAYEPGLSPRAVYSLEKKMVGFIMYGWWEEKNAWWIARMMVDRRYQGHGYGKATLEKVIEVMDLERPGQEIGISYVPSNQAAEALYTSLGFRPTGEDGGGEIIMRKPAQTQQ